jgi:hypothetical protein
MVRVGGGWTRAARTDFLRGKSQMLMSNPTIRAPVPVVIVALDPGGRALMTRDMELIRNIFVQIRSRTSVDLQAIDIPDVDPAILARHIEMLHDAGLIEAQKSAPLHGPLIFGVKDLTWAGHDFAAAIENDTVWNTIKQKLSAKELAGLPLGIVKDVAMGLLSHQIKSMFGL